MARQDNPFTLLDDDDEGDDVSVLLAKVEAKTPAPAPLPSATEQTKPKREPNGFPSKLLAPSEFVRGEGGRGRGGRGRGLVRGGFGNVGGSDAADQLEHLYRGYSGESGGERIRGRGARGGIGRGRGRGFTALGNRNRMEYGNAGDGREEEGEFQEKGYYGESRPPRYDGRKFGGENQGPDGEEGENRGFRGYGADRENRGLREHVSGMEKREFRDGEGNQRKREFKDGESYERSYVGDGENRGFTEGRGRGYGGRGRRGGRDGGRAFGRYDSNNGWNASETKKASADEKELTVNNPNNGDGGSERDDPSTTEEPKDAQSEKPIPEKIASEDASKVPEDNHEMTLAEYEKVLQEKRKPLESLKVETRKVVVDKDFEGMQIIEKKKEVDFAKKLDNDKGKKKDISEREEKSRKSQSINEFLKPADGERYNLRGGAAASRGHGGRGRGRGGYISDYPRQATASVAAPSLEDPAHFPILGAAAKA
ncbi:RGG repeats nuclear RNA binding protein A-like isoform X2 [Phalaenopsis equestris]|uniref:RGG repeats nuclear RNA binding protein A-like isoform X2 n=1 Tax=Phalaenopsis equestris TaxID=78828 RepID=UPI0009E59DA1|nr:RGG repeats nuclear RNA binding protein A-like isoform X2 [Phalaenopsis equestris]